MPDRVDGIVVLGGVVDQFLSEARGQTVIGGAVERITVSARLARQYPDARIVYSGGSGALGRQELKEASYVKPVFAQLGVTSSRLIIEDQSRNTAENATLTKELVKPAPEETWILVTSAFHMPRALGVFRRAGWSVIPYPVDYSTEPDQGFRLTGSLMAGFISFGVSLREWIGLVAYRLTDRTDAFFPALEMEKR